MAIIKCPECGHQISDKAPTCPNCGVEIAGKVRKCAQCGNVFFNDEERCPICHTPNPSRMGAQGQTQPAPPPVPHIVPQQQAATPAELPKKKKSRAPYIISFVIALIICAVCFYFYQKANNDKEQQEYAFALRSSDPLVLQTYLDNFLTAPQDHRDSIMSHLQALKQADIDWTNAVVSNSKAAIEDYLKTHPNTNHRVEALHKIDSIDWTQASGVNTPESYQEYLAQHADGEHATEAQQLFDKMNASKVSDDDKQMIASLFRHYFQSINAKDENGLVSTVANILTSFLGKENATKNDVIGFLHKIYKEGIANMNFRLNNDFKIDKKEVGVDEYEFSVSFSADQAIDKEDGKKELNTYKIKATVSPEGKISGLNMNKIVAEPKKE